MNNYCQYIMFQRNKFYFGKFRNFGGKNHWIMGILSYFLFLPLAYYASRNYRIDALIFVPLVPLSVYFYIRGMWSYKRTNMMLNADGAETWSIHMAPLVTFLPCFFARQPNKFIMRGTRLILRECRTQGFTGTVILRSHILGKKRTREKIAEHLQQKFSQYTVTASEDTTQLGVVHAWSLSWIRNARLKKRGGIRKRRLSRDHPVGVITIKC